jgi:dsDNA-specific endonuclease/ATPase MutS2
MKAKDTKRREAQERQERWNSLTVAEKIEIIKNRPGNSAREVAKLLELNN